MTANKIRGYRLVLVFFSMGTKRALLLAVSGLLLSLLLGACTESDATQTTTDDPGTALRMAVRGNDAGQVADLLEQGADPNSGLFGITPLLIAAREGHIEITQILLAYGADVNATGGGGSTALATAMWKPHIEIARALLDAGADVNAGDEVGYTPLHRAVHNAGFESVKLLLEHGADVTAVTEYGDTPLLAAVQDQSPEVIQLLIDNGADVHQSTGLGETTALHEAITNISVMQVLLDNGADINATDYWGKTPLHYAVDDNRGGSIPDNPDDPAEVIRFLVANGANIEARNDHGYTPIMCCDWEKGTAVAALLVELGADINAQDEEGQTLLHHYAGWFMNDGSLIEAMVSLGADTEIPDLAGNKPIYGAMTRRSTTSMQNLIRAGAEIDLVVAAGMGNLKELTRFTTRRDFIQDNPELATKAVSMASRNDHLDIVDFLLKRGAEPRLRDMARVGYLVEMQELIDAGADVNEGIDEKYTALHVASLEGQNDAVRLLVSAGADINAHGYMDRTPLERAIRNDHFDTVGLLLELGADPDARFHFGGTALHWAASSHNYAATKLLIDAGADVNAVNDSLGTPLMMAVSSARPDATLVKLLIESGADMNARNDYGHTAVYGALNGGLDNNMEPLEALLAAGADPNIPGDLGFTPLSWAVAMSNRPAVELLLHYGADLDYVAPWGSTALMTAISYDNDELAELLRSHGAEEPSAEMLAISQQ